MCSLWRSPTTRSPESTSGDFIFNLAIAAPGKLEIGTRQYDNWRLHEPPDFLPFCQPGALSTRLYCSRMPRHRTRPPGRYNMFVKLLLRKLLENVSIKYILHLFTFIKWRFSKRFQKDFKHNSTLAYFVLAYFYNWFRAHPLKDWTPHHI